MPKLTIDDLKKIKEKHKVDFALREGSSRVKVTVHMGTCGIACGSRDVLTALTEMLSESDITDVIITTSGCAGFCSKEPMATVEILGQTPVKYALLDSEKMKQIFKEHIQGGKVVEEYALVMGSETSY